MYIDTRAFPVMAGEPHLGSVEESELVAAPGEEVACFLAYWTDNGFAAVITEPDEITGEDIELKAEDYFSVAELAEWQQFFDEGERTTEEIADFYAAQ